MKHWIYSQVLRFQTQIATGGLTLGILTALEDINFNNILFQFLSVLVSLFATVLFGGDTSALTA